MTTEGFEIIRCPECGIKNRVPAQKDRADARCGKCGSPLAAERAKTQSSVKYVIRCLECGAKNRVPGDKVTQQVRCGKCQAPLQLEGLFNGQPLIVTDADFDAKVIRSPLPVLFFCWAPWCPSCRTMIPEVDDLAKTWKGRIRVGKLNMDGNPMVPNRFGIMSVPSLLIFDNGKLKDKIVGAVPRHQIVAKMAPYL